jgi:hypothetical protein
VSYNEYRDMPCFSHRDASGKCNHTNRNCKFVNDICRCSGYWGIPVHLLLGPVIGPSSAQGRINNPSYGEDPHEEVPREENDGGKC